MEPGKSPNTVVNDLIDFNKHENLTYRIRVKLLLMALMPINL